MECISSYCIMNRINSFLYYYVTRYVFFSLFNKILGSVQKKIEDAVELYRKGTPYESKYDKESVNFSCKTAIGKVSISYKKWFPVRNRNNSPDM